LEIYQFLQKNNIAYERHDHAPVFTFEEANRLVPDLQAPHTKNVFIRDRKGRNHFMVMVGEGRRIDLDALSELLGVSRLGLASARRLHELLGVDPGSVSPLALVNDPGRKVRLLLDNRLADEAYFQCHPLVNTSTLLLNRQALLDFLEAVGHAPRWMEIPYLSEQD